MSIHAAIFDADGTILDSMGIWAELGERYLNTLGIAAKRGLSDILSSMSLEEGCAYLKEKYALKNSIEELQKGLIDILSDFYIYEVREKPGITDFLSNLKAHGIPMVIATAGNTGLLSSALKRLNIYGYFDRIFTCGELNTTKKEPHIYQVAATFLNTDPDETLVFEDVLFAIKTAKEAGFYTVGVEDHSSEQDRTQIIKTADYYLTDFTDFKTFWRHASGK